MHRRRVGMVLSLLLLTGAPLAPAADLAPGAAAPAAVPSASPTAAANELTATIDARVAAKWQEAGVRPARRATDAEFLRRGCLAVTGRIPSVSEARDFLDNASADKRDRLVERLLASPDYSAPMASIWKGNRSRAGGDKGAAAGERRAMGGAVLGRRLTNAPGL